MIRTQCHSLQDKPLKKCTLKTKVRRSYTDDFARKSLDPRVKAIFEKQIVPQFIKKFSLFYGPWKFVTLLTRARHLSHMLGQISPISHPIYWKSMFILSFHICLRVPSGILPSGLPTSTLYAPILSSIHFPCRTTFGAGTLTFRLRAFSI